MIEDKIISRWLINIDASEKTSRTFTHVIHDYAEYMGQTPEQIIQGYTQDIKNGLLMPERQIFSDVPIYINYIKNKKPNRLKRNGDNANGLSPKSVHVYRSALKSFFENNYIEFPILKKGKKVQPLAVNANTFLSREQVREMISNAANLRDRALVMMIATSGMGSSEVRLLKLSNLTIDDNDIATIKLRREKAQYDYTTFASPETVRALRDYWNERKRITGHDMRQTDYVFVGTWSNHVLNNKPIVERTVSSIFKRLGEGLGYDYKESGELIATRSHGLRKFFSSTLRRAGMAKDYTDALLGHVPKDVDRSYFEHLDETLKDEYVQYLPHLTFSEDIVIKSFDTKDTERLNELEKENKGMKTKLSEMEELKAQMADMKEFKESLIEAKVKEMLEKIK